MTEKELEEIISLKDRDRILSELKKRGFRETGTDGDHEFDHGIISKESAYRKEIIVKDIPARREYQGYLFKDNKTYTSTTFILFNVFAIISDINIPVPRTMILLTDAPYDIEYALRSISPCKCAHCGKKYMKKDMFVFDTELLCIDCFEAAQKNGCPDF